MGKIEPLILGPEKIISIFDTEFFKYPEKDKEEQKQEKKPKDTLKPEINVNSHNLEDLVSKTKSVERLTSEFTDKCLVCSFEGRMDWQVTLFDGSWGLLCGSCGDKLAEKLRETS